MPLGYHLTEEQKMIQTMVRELARERLAPRAAEIDRTSQFPWDTVELFRERQLYQLPIPEAYGGAGASEFTCALVTEEIAKVCASSSHILADHWLGITPLLIAGSEAQKKKFFPEMLTRLTAFSITEPEAGSDIANAKTRALTTGQKYVLNGTKCFCTDGAFADFVSVFAKTDPQAGAKGLSVFIVEKGTPGFSVGKIEDQMGMRGSPAAELIFEDCPVPRENRIGAEGDGFRIAMGTFDRTRPIDAMVAVGIAQGALDYALDYARQRVQFGRSIVEFQGIQFMLADMATSIEAARLLSYKAMCAIDEGNPDSMLSAMAKYFATDTAMKVTTDAVQVMGGYGLMKDHPLERMMRDAKVLQILEGTNQIQRIVVARRLIG